MTTARTSKSSTKAKGPKKPNVEHGSPHSPVDRDTTPEREKVRDKWKRDEPRR